MQCKLNKSKYTTMLQIGDKDSIVTLDTGSPMTILRDYVVKESLKSEYESFILKITKYKPKTMYGFNGGQVNLYPAAFERAVLAGVVIEPFVCYIDMSGTMGNNLIGADIISACVINRSVGDYCIDIDIVDFNKYLNNFVNGYREFVDSTTNILEELNKSSSRNSYLEGLFGAASAAIDK